MYKKLFMTVLLALIYGQQAVCVDAKKLLEHCKAENIHAYTKDIQKLKNKNTLQYAKAKKQLQLFIEEYEEFYPTKRENRHLFLHSVNHSNVKVFALLLAAILYAPIFFREKFNVILFSSTLHIALWGIFPDMMNCLYNHYGIFFFLAPLGILKELHQDEYRMLQNKKQWQNVLDCLNQEDRE